MKRTRITELFGIEHPVVQGGMIWNAGAKLAAAVSEAGGLGLIGAGSMRPDLFRSHIRKARKLTDKPFGVNIPLIYKYAGDFVETALDEGVDIFFTSAGSPKKYTPLLKDKGAVVFHVVSSPGLAAKCGAAGVDGVVAEGFEAGGHNGRDEITTMVLVPQTVKAVDIPVLAAGGIVTGGQIAAALAMGADGVQMGTRFALTEESSSHRSFKEECVKSASGNTRLVMKKLIPVRLIKNRFCREIMEAEDRGAGKEELMAMLGKGRAMKGMFEGDLEEGELEIGQGIGLTDEVIPVGEVFENLEREYAEAVKRLE